MFVVGCIQVLPTNHPLGPVKTLLACVLGLGQNRHSRALVKWTIGSSQKVTPPIPASFGWIRKNTCFDQFGLIISPGQRIFTSDMPTAVAGRAWAYILPLTHGWYVRISSPATSAAAIR